ncbi:hypothetical protein BLOT_007736 [Blomia tropicalis]|nr:hypothetical protein BLOT_007736 [Blomia tropicalis]
MYSNGPYSNGHLSMHNNKSSNCMIEISLNHWLQMSYLQCETIEGAHLNASQLSHANESSHIARYII